MLSVSLEFEFWGGPHYFDWSSIRFPLVSSSVIRYPLKEKKFSSKLWNIRFRILPTFTGEWLSIAYRPNNLDSVIANEALQQTSAPPCSPRLFICLFICFSEPLQLPAKRLVIKEVKILWCFFLLRRTAYPHQRKIFALRLIFENSLKIKVAFKRVRFFSNITSSVIFNCLSLYAITYFFIINLFRQVLGSVIIGFYQLGW